MLSRSLNLALRFSPHRGVLQATVRNSTSSTDEQTEKDPAPYFFNEEIQNLLKTITRPNPEKVFRRRLDGQSLEAPEYKFMTEEQLQKALRKAEIEMNRLLQMPPVVKVRKERTKVFSKDPALQGLTETKWVFTDITFGVKNADRLIAVREPDGTLRDAYNKERDRLNQVYFPMPGREIRMPKMFEAEHMEEILIRGDYDFILNRACVQFDPDDENFQRVAHEVYEYVDKNLHHDKLRSTRHYGPMVFHLAWNKTIDNLLIENISTGRIEDAAIVIRLYYILNPDKNVSNEKDSMKLIKHFIEKDSLKKSKVDHALRTYLEVEQEKKQLEENIKKAHGKE